MNNDDEREKMGPACKTCGHPAGAHQPLAGEDLDSPENPNCCRFGDCQCQELII